MPRSRREHPPLEQANVTRCRVTYRMTDQMGLVYYGNYLEMFEIGRTELLREAGATYREMEAEGYYLPVVHATVDYVSPARYDDLLAIHTWISLLTRIRVDFQYAIMREGESVPLCVGVSHHAVVGPDGHVRRLDAQWMARLERLAG